MVELPKKGQCPEIPTYPGQSPCASLAEACGAGFRLRLRGFSILSARLRGSSQEAQRFVKQLLDTRGAEETGPSWQKAA